MEKLSDTSCRENQCTHFAHMNFISENHVVYEVIRKSMMQSERPHLTIQSMRFANWITKATNTHSEYVLLIAFPRQKWLRERQSVLRCTYVACLVEPFIFVVFLLPILAVTRQRPMLLLTC